VIVRRTFFSLLAALLVLAGCASPPPAPSLPEAPPIVFVHGNGDSAAVWTTTIWRFESNGWPRDRLHAVDHPYPLARDDDTKAQPGRSSTAEHMAFLKAEVEQVLKRTGAKQVVLMGNSRGGNAIRNYIVNGGGAATVSHAILGGTPNHGVWAIKGFREGNEFSGTGPFLTGLNAPKNAAGDEVTGPVKWLTVRSENNDKFAQPDGLWIGMKGSPTFVTSAGPELKGATNVVVPRIDHRETSFSPAAFEASYRFITGKAPRTTTVEPEALLQIGGKITGSGLNPTDPASGSFTNNLPLAGARVDVYAVNPTTGAREGAAVLSQTVGADGRYGPFTARAGVPYEFMVAAAGYATTHVYRSPFPRSSPWVFLRPERIADADKSAGALVNLNRPRGYFDPQRDRINFDGQATPPGVVPGAGVSTSRLKLTDSTPRTVTAEFNGERLVGRVWPAAENRTSVLELHY
jgi:triacylglycerol lipase